MRLLAVDLGKKRIGIAVGESQPQVISTRPALTACGVLKLDAESVNKIAKREEVDHIVVGLPLEEGEEGRMASVCRKFGEILTQLGWSVKYADETLTSVQANANMAQLDMKASLRKKLRDGEAAALILERFLYGETTA